MAKAAYHRTAFLGALILLGTLPAARAGWLNQLKSRAENAVQGAAQHMTNDATGTSSSRPSPGTPPPTPTPAATPSPASGSTPAQSAPVTRRARLGTGVVAKLVSVPASAHVQIPKVSAICPMPANWKHSRAHAAAAIYYHQYESYRANVFLYQYCRRGLEKEVYQNNATEICRCVKTKLHSAMAPRTRTLAAIRDKNIKTIVDYYGIRGLHHYRMKGVELGMSDAEAAKLLEKAGYKQEPNAPDAFQMKAKSSVIEIGLGTTKSPVAKVNTVTQITYQQTFNDNVRLDEKSLHQELLSKYGQPDEDRSNPGANSNGELVLYYRDGDATRQMMAFATLHSVHPNAFQINISSKKFEHALVQTEVLYYRAQKAAAEHNKPKAKVQF